MAVSSVTVSLQRGKPQEVMELPSSPDFLSLQEGPVGGNLQIQGKLGVHELLVVTQQPGQVLLGLLQCILELIQFVLGIFECLLTTLLSITNGLLQVANLRKEKKYIIPIQITYPHLDLPIADHLSSGEANRLSLTEPY